MLKIKELKAFWQFVAIGSVTFVAVGYLFISFVEPAITDFVLEQQKLNPVVFANRLAAEFLSPRDFELPITEETVAHLKNFASHLQIPGLVRLEIWNRDGVIVYSDDEDLIGQQFPIEDDLQEALNLKTTAEIRHFDDQDIHHEHGVQFGDGLIVNVPVTFGGTKEAAGALTIHSRVGFLQQEITKIRNTIIGRVIISLTLIFSTLSFIVWRTSRTVVLQQKQLKDASAAQVKHAEELAHAKDEFVALASHQLRTPPSIINWYAEMLISGEIGALNDKQMEYVKEISQANERMVKLVSDFLNISRIESGTLAIKPEPTNIIDVSDSMIREFTKQIAERKIMVDKDYDKDLPPISVDQRIMVIALENLISNAIKYSPAGGKIAISIKKDGPDVVLCIKDNGYGNPKKDYGKVFTKLFRGENIVTKVAEGTGLGLYLTKAAIEQAGGTIRFESEEGKGSAFYVTIPLSGMKPKAGIVGLSAG